MPEIGQITRPHYVETDVDFGDGEVVHVVFDRNAITPAWVHDAESRDRDSDRDGLARALAAVIDRWDISENGEQLSATAENVARLSFPLQAFLLRGVLNAAVPSSAEGNASGGRSSIPSSDSTPPSPTSLNGPAVSSSPAPSASPSPG